MKFIAHLCDTLLLVFLQLLLRAYHLRPVANLSLHLLHYFRLGDLYTVDGSLMQEQFLHGYLLGDDTVGVSAPSCALLLCLQSRLLDIRLEYGLVAHHPNHLVDDTLLGYLNLFGSLIHGLVFLGFLVLSHRGESNQRQHGQCGDAESVCFLHLY